MMKKLLALVFAMGIFMTSTIYASADTEHSLSNLDLYQDGPPHFGVYKRYDAGFPSISMNVTSINQYYSGEIYCNLSITYQKKTLFGQDDIYNYTKACYTGTGGYIYQRQGSGQYRYIFNATRNGLKANNVVGKQFN